MPWFEENGLFPGRGMPVSGVLAAGAGAAEAGAAGAAGADSAAAGLAGVEAGASGAGLVASGLASCLAAFGLSAFGNAARSLAATGGAIVEEPPLTYSPSSSSLASATLVSIPSSLAMSYTRGSATFSPVRAYPNRAGFSAERISFRGTHLIASMFLCLFLGPVLKLGQVGFAQNSLETFSLNCLLDAA